jgi:hypothetical protein
MCKPQIEGQKIQWPKRRKSHDPQYTTEKYKYWSKESSCAPEGSQILFHHLYLLPVSVHEHLVLYSKEEFEDTRWVIRIRQLSASLSAWHSWYIFQFTDHLNLKFSRQNIWYVCLLKPKTVTAILHTYLPYCTHICHATHILVILPTYLSYCTHICHTAHIFIWIQILPGTFLFQWFWKSLHR